MVSKFLVMLIVIATLFSFLAVISFTGISLTGATVLDTPSIPHLFSFVALIAIVVGLVIVVADISRYRD